MPYRVLAAEQQPAPDRLAALRQRPLAARATLFTPVRRRCQAPGLVKRGPGALEGTQVTATAAKHQAMSSGRRAAAEQKLEAEVQSLLGHAAAGDSPEAARAGQGQRGEELPAE